MSKTVQAQNKMGTAPMLPLIFSMALPAMFSMLVQALYNIVDSYFVSQLSQKALSAVSLAFPIQNLQIAFAVGTAVGVTSLISRRLGQGRREEAGSAAVHGLLLGIATSLVFAIYGAFFTTPFFQMFETDQEIIHMGDQYISICCIFSFGCFVSVMLEKTLQATGNMIWPMVFQLVGAVTNIALDPVFIFGYFGMPAMGVTGAAVATVAGQIVSMIVCILVMAFGKHEIRITFHGFRLSFRTIKDIYAVGLPAIVMQAIGTVMNMAMNGILSGFSTEAYTVFGLYFKLQSFVFMPVFGLTQGLLPIMAYNYGARNKHRMLSALKQGCIIALVIMAAGMLVFLLLPEQLLGIFSASAKLLEIGVPALRTICTCFLFAALGIVTSTLFQSVGRGTYSLIISLMRQLIVLVPAAWLLARLTRAVSAVWWAFPIAETVSLLASVFFFLRLYSTEIKIWKQQAPVKQIRSDVRKERYYNDRDSQEILEKYQIRNKKEQKKAFREFLQEKLPGLFLESGGRLVHSDNLILGDPDTAQVVFSAHYDTCTTLPIPNFLTPKNIPLYVLYNLLLCVVFFAVAFVTSFLVMALTHIFLAAYFASLAALILCLLLFFAGKPNPHTANDNTSGVVALCEIYASLTEEQRQKAAFVFFDNEELGLFGSRLFLKHHKEAMKGKLLLNLDCVSDGDHLMMILNKTAQSTWEPALQSAFDKEIPSGKTVLWEKSSRTLYPSDQMGFPCYGAIAAFRKNRFFGLYLNRIHTKRDTVFQKENITWLQESGRRLIEQLSDTKNELQ